MGACSRQQRLDRDGIHYEPTARQGATPLEREREVTPVMIWAGRVLSRDVE